MQSHRWRTTHAAKLRRCSLLLQELGDVRCMILLTGICMTPCPVSIYATRKKASSRLTKCSAARASTLCRMKGGSLTRGIAIPAGGAVLLGNAWASIKVLQLILYQRLHSRLLLSCQQGLSLGSASQRP